jgi:hypothetical protein
MRDVHSEKNMLRHSKKVTWTSQRETSADTKPAGTLTLGY